MKSLTPMSRSAGRLLTVIGGAALLAGGVAMLPAAGSASQPPARSGWVATWAASPIAGTAQGSPIAHAGFNDQTVRNVIYTSVGGDELRVRVSNTFGTTPLRVGAVSVGVVLVGARLVPGTVHAVTFRGKTSVTISAGAQALSDPLSVRVMPLEELAVSMYFPTATGPATYHMDAQQTGYLAAGDHAGEAAATGYATNGTSWYFLDGLDVHDPAAPGTIVAFGDSITDGSSGLNVNGRWPNYLARRLHAIFGSRAPAVVDEGISGNRVLSNSDCFGESAAARFERDALSQPGVKEVILLEGVNDIGFSGETDGGCFAPNNAALTAAQLEAGYRHLIRMAHARGIKILAGTLTPFMGSHDIYGGNFGTAHGERLRAAVNTWIRTSHAFDGVVDFAKVIQSPYDPLFYNPAYNSYDDATLNLYDNLHPNVVGYEVMAHAIKLAMLAWWR